MRKIQILINNRQRNILKAVLRSGGTVTMKEISEKTGYSIRVVRYNMPTVQIWLRNEGIEMSARPGHGFIFDCKTEEITLLLNKLEENSDSPLSLTKKQRLRVELLSLLTTPKPVSFQAMAESEGISRSTIVTDVSQIEEWLNRFNMRLIKTPNRGTYAEGSELFRRCAVVDLVRMEIGLVAYYGIWLRRHIPDENRASLPGSFRAMLERLDLDTCRGYVEKIEADMGLRLALYSRIEVLLYLAITLENLKEPADRNTMFHLTPFEVPDGPERRTAEALFETIRQDTGFTIEPYEQNFLTIILLFSKWDNEDIILDPMDEYTGERTYNISHEALNCSDMLTAACANRIHPLLQTDEELIMNLARHFHTVFNQIHYGYPIINENLPGIIREYPEIFRTVNSEISIIEDQIGNRIPPEEIGYIVMYIVSALNKLQTEKHFRIWTVILGDGIRTKTVFLKNRLQLFFPTIEVIAVINGVPEDDRIFEKADLILSLIPDVQAPKPVIEVSPFLTPDEIRKVQNRIIEHEEKGRQSLLTPGRMPNLMDLLLIEHILIRKSASDWREVIRMAAEPLEEEKLIKPSFCDAMIRLTEEYGPYTTLAPGVALLNARPNDGVSKLCMSLIILERPVDFGVTENISAAFVLGAADNHSHLNALYQLSKICEQKDFISSLKACRRPSEVLRLVWRCSTGISLN